MSPTRMKSEHVILNCSDEKILELSTRESGYVDYRLGRKVSVSYRGGDKSLCLTCIKDSCPHVERIRRYREENLERLNFVAADPSTGVPIA